MATTLIQLQNRINELESLADEVFNLVNEGCNGKDVQPELQVKGQQWYRGARELLEQQKFSGLKDFEVQFNTYISEFIGIDSTDPTAATMVTTSFAKPFRKARSLLLSLEAELLSRELPVRTQLSFEVSGQELDTAEALLKQHGGDEALLRASGVVARVALERHLFCVVDARSIAITTNPPSKKKPDVEDVLSTLVKANVITAIQKSHFDSLFRIANNCAHPKEAVAEVDVARLIRDGRAEAAAVR